MGLAVGADLVGKLLGGVNLADIQSLGQVSLGVVDTAAIQVTGQQHHIQQMRRAEEVGSAGALVLLTGIQCGGDNGLGIDIVLTEVGAGIAALELGLGGFDVHIVVDGVQVVIVPDRADMLLLDLHLVPLFTAVADHDGSGDFLIQVLPHHAILVLHHIEIGDVDDVVPVQGILAVNGLGVGGALDQLHVAGSLLQVALAVAVGAQVAATSIHLTGADAADGALVGLLHDYAHPALVTLKQFRIARAQILIVREESLDVVDAVLQFLILLGINAQSGLEAAHAGGFGHRDDALLVRMAQHGVLGVFLVENIVLHGVVSSFRVIVFLLVGVVLVLCIIARLALGERPTNQPIHHGFLLLGHAVHHILDVLIIAIFFLAVVGIALLVIVVLLIVGGVREGDFLGGGEDEFLLGAFAVSQIYKIDERAGVCARHNQTDLADHTMNHIAVLLFQLVGIDGQGLYIPMLDQEFGRFAALGLVEGTVGIYAICPVFQQGMSQNVGGIVVLVVPYQRDHSSITILECVLLDGPSIGADKVVSGCPAAKVTFQLHFELLPPSVL